MRVRPRAKTNSMLMRYLPLGTFEVTQMVDNLQMEVDNRNSKSTNPDRSGSGSVPSNLHFSKQPMGASLVRFSLLCCSFSHTHSLILGACGGHSGQFPQFQGEQSTLLIFSLSS